MAKIKEILFTDEDKVQNDEFATKRECIYFVGMIISLFLNLVVIIFLTASMAICEKLVQIVVDDREKIEALVEDNDYYYTESLRYKMMYEDLYETYVYPNEREEMSND